MSELEVKDLITVQQAIGIIDAAEIEPRVEWIRLEQCAGLYLAEDLRSDRDAPPFDKSLMDGYAVRSGDLATLPRELTVAGRIMAGGSASSPLGKEQTMAIMTGAPLPGGADAVVPIEQTTKIEGSNRVRFCQPTAVGRFIARRGSDSTSGSIVLKKGMRLGPAQVAIAASIGAVNVPTYQSPSVAVLGTGDELVPPDKTPAPNQIRSCNNPMLLSLLRRFPCGAIDLGLVNDDPKMIQQRIEAGLTHDVLLITGGMSMGERDFVPDILRRLGAELKITKLRIKPGKPFVFAKMPGGKFVFGLPGNPVSAFVCTLCLASRLLERMAGALPGLAMRTALLAQPLEANGNRTFYQPAIFDGRAIHPLQWKGSADVYTLSDANALLVRAENQPPQPAGAAVDFIEL
ncbi:MAG TPA: gephyrin-like molybdotransferase Glp [Tepidisphaeraceae bacterium]|jgi:molybdopterin molybdotransferase|nr:gephyrin-like molybdotransferase Glp [Tepidisphaeraceae bacterium]